MAGQELRVGAQQLQQPRALLAPQHDAGAQAALPLPHHPLAAHVLRGVLRVVVVPHRVRRLVVVLLARQRHDVLLAEPARRGVGDRGRGGGRVGGELEDGVDGAGAEGVAQQQEVGPAAAGEAEGAVPLLEHRVAVRLHVPAGAQGARMSGAAGRLRRSRRQVGRGFTAEVNLK